MQKIETTANSFTANGKKYLISPSLSVGRFIYFEELQVMFGWGTSYKELDQKVLSAMKAINDGKQGEAYVVLNNVRERLKDARNRQHPALLLCTLFINREDEDTSTWSETEANEKIKDWEGIEVGSFFSLASSLVGGFSNELSSPAT